MKKLDKVFKAGVVAVGVVTAGAAGATCDSNGNCWSTSTNGSSAASAVGQGGAGGSGGAGGNAVLNAKTPRVGFMFGGGSAMAVPGNGSYLQNSGEAWSFNVLGIGGSHSAPSTTDQRLLDWEVARNLGALYLPPNSGATDLQQVAAHAMLAKVSPAYGYVMIEAAEAQARLEANKPLDENNADGSGVVVSPEAVAAFRLVNRGAKAPTASGAAAPVATLPAADGAGVCNVYIDRDVAPSYRVGGALIPRKGGGGGTPRSCGGPK